MTAQTVRLVVYMLLYSLSVLALLAMSHYKRARDIQIFQTRSLRLGLMLICTGLCCSSWRFCYVASGEHATTLGVGLLTFLLITAPIGWVYYRRRQSEGHTVWEIKGQR